MELLSVQRVLVGAYHSLLRDLDVDPVVALMRRTMGLDAGTQTSCSLSGYVRSCPLCSDWTSLNLVRQCRSRVNGIGEVLLTARRV